MMKKIPSYQDFHEGDVSCSYSIQLEISIEACRIAKVVS